MIKLVNDRVGRFGRKLGIRRKKEFICGYCGKKFISGAWRKAKFCSYECYWKAKKGTKVVQNISPKEIQKRKKRMMGDKNPMWCGGDSDKERRNAEYRKWRMQVFKRDGFKCKKCGYFNGCGEKRKDINAHHIVKWIDSIELRYEVENGVTLCVPCHINEHTNIS